MKASIRDHGALAALKPFEVMAYLRSKGWTSAGEQAGEWVLWICRDARDEEVEVALPTTDRLRDFVLRMGDVLSGIEAIEQRSQLEILRDLYVANSDVIRVRLADAELNDGSLPIEEGARLFQKARDMMFAAASAAIATKAYYPGRRSTAAADYLNKTRFGQTEQGSFTLTIVSKVPPNLAAPGAPGAAAVEAEEPFERKVTHTLATSLNAVRLSAQRAAVSGGIESFVDAVGQGVSANLCDALIGMSDSADAVRTLDFDFRWSASRPNTAARNHSKIHLPPDALPYLQSASRYFKETTPRDEFQLHGLVVKLEKAASEPTGKVTVAAIVDDQQRRVTLELREADYQKAISAHEHNHEVRAAGVLVKEGRSFRLADATGFDVEIAGD